MSNKKDGFYENKKNRKRSNYDFKSEITEDKIVENKEVVKSEELSEKKGEEVSNGIKKTISLENEECALEDSHDEVHEEVIEKSSDEVTVDNTPKSVRVSIPDLNIRKGPGKNFDRTGKFTGKGVFAVTKIQDGWAELETGGWISMEFCELL